MTIIAKASTLTQWLLATQDSNNRIDSALAEWLIDSDWPDTVEGIKGAIGQLEAVNCADGCAPHGLIYTSDLMDKLSLWQVEIIRALSEYYDATGETYKTDEPSNFVWFAVEWRAHELASELRSYFDIDC